MAPTPFDIIADTTPQLSPPLTIHAGRPSIATLRAALSADDGTTYTEARLNSMTYNDLIAATGGATAPVWQAYAVTPNPVEDADYDEGFTFVATGFGDIAYSVVDGTLPAGMTLDASSGVLDGTPTDDGASAITVRATNAFGYADVDTTITVVAA